MWNTVLRIAINFVFKKLIADIIMPWINELRKNVRFQRAIELAMPLIEKFEEAAYETIMSGYEKREAVKENLTIQLKEEGIELADYILNNAIETAIVALTEAGVINVKKDG